MDRQKSYKATWAHLKEQKTNIEFYLLFFFVSVTVNILKKTMDGVVGVPILQTFFFYIALSCNVLTRR